MLFTGPEQGGFAKALFRGEFRGSSLFPYPELPESQRATVETAVAAVREFADSKIDAAAIDREADIPRSVIDGLGHLGVLGMAAPQAMGRPGLLADGILQNHGGDRRSLRGHRGVCQCPSFDRLAGTGPVRHARAAGAVASALASGEKLAAFALTEEQAGSDASNVQTTARPTDDGQTYILNGSKRYITNGAIADVLDRDGPHARPAGGDSKVTAFLVTPDLPGFEVVEARMPKCGIRGTATARLAFHDMPVPATNILGPLGKGLKVALTVLDFGRTTFGASCTGAAKVCLAAAARHAASRRQFGRPLADLELIKKEDRLSRRDRLRDGSHHLPDGRLDRPRLRRLHARNRHSQGLHHRGLVARRVRDAPGLRRPGLLQQRALRTNDAQRAHQHDR